MALTDVIVRQSPPGDKPFNIHDEKGLYLRITTSGGKLWRFDYRFGGKRKTLALGKYPETTLAGARDGRDEARRMLANGIDPGEHRKLQKAASAERAANSFREIALEWYAKMAPNWSPGHGDRIIRRLERDIFPWLGKKPIAEITPPEILKSVRRIEDRGRLETAHRALQNCGQVFRYAVATGRADRDPVGDLKGALPPVRQRHFPTIIDPTEVGGLLRAIDGYRGTLAVKSALQLAPLVFVRPGELRRAKWADVDLAAAEWRFMVSKTETNHIVPLSRQASAILRELRPLTGRGPNVFPGLRDHNRPMSEAAINAALRRMGFDTRSEFTGHGFRAMARTILHEQLGFDPNVIEHQLAHRVPDALGAAYNRTKFLPQRREMMQRWADHLDQLKAGAKIIAFGSAVGDGAD